MPILENASLGIAGSRSMIGGVKIPRPTCRIGHLFLKLPPGQLFSYQQLLLLTTHLERHFVLRVGVRAGIILTCF